MTPIHLTPGDQLAMIRAATERAASSMPAVTEYLMAPATGKGDLEETEAALACAALGALLRARVEHVLGLHVAGGEGLLRRLDEHVAERVAEARSIRNGREVVRG